LTDTIPAFCGIAIEKMNFFEPNNQNADLRRAMQALLFKGKTD
jgi:hypothetical protein